VEPQSKGALSRGVARVAGSPWAKPIARVLLVAAGLVLLAAIGRVGSAGAFGGTPSPAVLGADAAAPSLPPAVAEAPVPPAPPAASAAPATATPSAGTHGAASPDDPVVLNVATGDDLRRLPGIGPKRADAILALRTRLGRFRALEDLLKVKGIGRATLKRLRPLVRLDAPPLPTSALMPGVLADAGAGPK
jgi:competence protein ComEA